MTCTLIHTHTVPLLGTWLASQSHFQMPDYHPAPELESFSGDQSEPYKDQSFTVIGIRKLRFVTI